MIKLREYQQIDYDKIISALPEHKAILLSAACGYGKSVLIAHLSNTLNGRVLVLTHRRELLTQNSMLMEDYSILNAKVKYTEPIKHSKVVVCMAQTLIRRIEKYGSNYVGKFDTIIIDETHLDFFAKIYNLIEHKNRIGLTATPIIDKKETRIFDGEEYYRELSLADEYDFLIQGICERDLIDLGYLVEDVNVMLKPPNLDELKGSNSNPDGYTTDSLTAVFGNQASIKTLYEAYERYGIGNKTIIFNPTTKTNLNTYNFFVDKIGADKVRLYDSVNDTEHTREETVEWFKSVPDALLLNVGVFTTGFDVPELKVILFNKKTKSLGLFLQIAGRGSRPSPQKLNFLFVDMGLNLEEHGRWSAKRDWSKYFVTHEWKRKKVSDVLSIWECKHCGEWNLMGTFYNAELDRIECNNCHKPKEQREARKLFINGDFVMLEEPIIPIASRLIPHVKRMNGDGNDVLKMARNQIVELFRYHTSEEHFRKNRIRYVKRIGELYRPIYFSVLNDKELNGSNKKLSTQYKAIIKRVDKIYYPNQ